MVVYPPKPMMHIAHSPISTKFINPPIFAKFINSPPIFVQLTFFGVFCFHNIWPRCIYASCNTRTGRPFMRFIAFRIRSALY